MHVERDELEQKYILKKFFNFTEAFILHVKISHKHTHTYTATFPYPTPLPYTPLSCNQNYFVRKAKSSHRKLEMGNPATKRKL